MQRHKPLRRTAFKSKRPKHEPSIFKEEKPMARSTLKPLARGVYGAAVLVARPKEPKAKPGKGAPNRAERKWLDAIVEYGCLACRMDGRGYVPACVHHILRGSVRMGHLYSLPLCPPHHQKETGSGVIARHPDKARFEAKYGYEMDLLLQLQRELGFEPLWEVL